MRVANISKFAGDGLSETNTKILLIIDCIIVLKESEPQNPFLPAAQSCDFDIALVL